MAEKKKKFVPQGVVPAEYRRWIYMKMILGAFLLINPLVLYRSGISHNLVLDQWFGFASFWQQNPVGLSVLELAWWSIVDIWKTTTVFGMTIADQVKWIVVIAGTVGLTWYGWKVFYFTSLSRKALNSWALIGVVLKKAALIGGAVAVVMFLINLATGKPFSFWQIFEVSLWTGQVILACIVAAGLLWNRDVRGDTGAIGTNQTMGDPDAGHHHDDEF